MQAVLKAACADGDCSHVRKSLRAAQRRRGGEVHATPMHAEPLRRLRMGASSPLHALQSNEEWLICGAYSHNSGDVGMILCSVTKAKMACQVASRARPSTQSKAHQQCSQEALKQKLFLLLGLCARMNLQWRVCVKFSLQR